ncbi:glucosyltransferase [Exophiala xenobiotica]|nr:glucosyltransferase [Exophiala xenobiotica]KAK5197253.1 glucosyltransferase [Exophiala xenobiotica]KAK5274352.1 glucosyltransferase [Exophiala xenobiotica]KAK5343680.1 glucosyltransferase [Exophiala xenobiotica]KAK5559321.1 glucosyltransferase [Exophiala xenobiotica]
MSYFVSPEFARVLVLGFITSLHMTWRRLVNQIVPVPYLDEVFHIPQAQAYWLGKWSQWDPKITTPPGLYIFSYIVNSVRDFFYLNFKPSVNEWRAINVFLLYLLLVALYILTAVGRKTVNHDSILQREFSILSFPLIFFFSALYYTDLFSVFTVVLVYIFWSASTSAAGSMKALYQFLHFVAGLVALSSRQTNIFWVAVYLGGLQVVESVKRNIGANKVHDPPMSEAYFEDFPITSISIAQSALTAIPQLLLDLWPQIFLILTFAAFVVWNGGVVLGDKDNHIATIHLPQMLYIWPFIVFFSWPVLLPQLSHLSAFRRRLPRLSTTVTVIILMLVTVHLNTIIHPFTLADNRHYTFYVFRILRQHWLLKYAAVPVYFVCAWLVLASLGGATEAAPASKTVRILYGEDTVCVSLTLVWLLATSLSLITAPLVEPRYFIIPWLMWRLAVPEYMPRADKLRTVELEKRASASLKDHPASLSSSTSSLQKLLRTAAGYSMWLELIWYLVINLGTCYMFLYKDFEWPQEPGNVQRFMW